MIIELMPGLRQQLRLDFVIANGENAAGGFGLTPPIAEDLFAAGIDCLSGGNHTFDQKEVIPLLESDKRVLRPLNYPPGTPGHGVGEYEDARGRKILVVNAMGRVFMDAIDDPFRAVDEVLKRHPMGPQLHCIVVDMHGEATSEKMAMGHFADGRVSMTVGSHSHVPTADAQILPAGSAYQTDAGMCGVYDSVIGMDKEEPLRRFQAKLGRKRFAPAAGVATICGVFLESDDKTGLAKRVEPLRLGGPLHEHIPEVAP
jgi:metallophosphoesterase (TIGR00282 family)